MPIAFAMNPVRGYDGEPLECSCDECGEVVSEDGIEISASRTLDDGEWRWYACGMTCAQEITSRIRRGEGEP